MGIFNRPLRRSTAIAGQPTDAQAGQMSPMLYQTASCECFGKYQNGSKLVDADLAIHQEVQDTMSGGWRMLESLIYWSEKEQSTDLEPRREIPPEPWSQIVTLPASIGKLTGLKRLRLNGSHLVRIPPEIGNLTNLEELDLYTSYRLHWLPFEVTRCKKLKRSSFSTRALYGNYKYRWPFPRLHEPIASLMPASRECSVCRSPISEGNVLQAWISLRVGTDVLPLLVNACSNECIRRLPPPADGYIEHPHRGGLDLVQPEPGMLRPRK
jgi:hypothetical protein